MTQERLGAAPVQASTFPATVVAHWSTGPVDCCDDHARALVRSGGVIGRHVAVTKAAEGAECVNCKNESMALEEKP